MHATDYEAKYKHLCTLMEHVVTELTEDAQTLHFTAQRLVGASQICEQSAKSLFNVVEVLKNELKQ